MQERWQKRFKVIQVESFLYILLAILGLGIIVFIHELGHYFVARREGMKVEAFSIGFGKPIYTWMRDGVKWMICILPFGGYVKIAGMQGEGGKEPSDIPDGFYGKKPIQRIRVAFAGPFANIVLAMLLFTVLWLSGGREKPLAEYTHRIGWVDPQSKLFELGVRPGDQIDQYKGKTFHGFKDLLTASLMKGNTAQIAGEKIEETTGAKTPFDYTLETYSPNPAATKYKINTIGILAPASYLIVGGFPENGAAVKESGIAVGDQIVWADGERVFSLEQLSSIVNDSSSFLTVKRGEEILQIKVPRVRIDDLKLNAYEKAEIGDWQYESGIKGKLQDLYFLPFAISPNLIIERQVDYVSKEKKKETLQEGDQIVAVHGKKVSSAYELLQEVQQRKVLLVVNRGVKETLQWPSVDAGFDTFDFQSLNELVKSIGQKEASVEGFRLIDPITPVSTANKLILGVGIKDQQIIYNPGPFKLFAQVTLDIWNTLTALFSGHLNPKYMSGPVGIVQGVHQSWMIGFKEAIFWMALISLNLGIVNLLPIPVLDGGHIVLSIFEWIRKKPLKAKTMERLVIPFVGLLILFAVYITYHDITRLFLKFFTL